MSMQRLSLTALLLLLAVPVFAQRFTAAIRGTVTDPSNAVIVGAKVTLKNEETGLTRTAHDQRGRELLLRRSARGQLPGRGHVAGSRRRSRTRIVLNVADVREVNVQLATGEITETVSVEAARTR